MILMPNSENLTSIKRIKYTRYTQIVYLFYNIYIKMELNIRVSKVNSDKYSSNGEKKKYYYI
jgi:hypothetical protein